MTNTSYRTVEDLPLMLDIKDVAKILGIGKNLAYSLVNSGEIKALRVGTKIRIPKQSLVDYITN
ncbi:MAG: helix-turn-helix domain-containing protein [Oscillibacter sp.]|nr:helix-turn-helix domain-containing protein [Oscillibacter sp.]